MCFEICWATFIVSLSKVKIDKCKQVAYKSIYIINKLELMSFLSETQSESTWYIVVYDKQNKYCNSNNCVMRAHFYGYLLLRISMKDPCHKHIKHQTCLLKVNILCSMSWHKSAMENVISHFYVNQFVIICNVFWECKMLLRSKDL